MKKNTKKGGRPPKEESRKLSRHIHFRITESEYEELERKRVQAGVSDLSAFLRIIAAGYEPPRVTPLSAELLRNMLRQLAGIARDARTIALKVSGEHYHMLYVDALLSLRSKAQAFIDEYLDEIK
jgi:hypothetical protein